MCPDVTVGLPSISVSFVKTFTVPFAPSSAIANATVSSFATGASFTGVTLIVNVCVTQLTPGVPESQTSIVITC